MKKNIYAVILAGGAGTRFWPKSRQSCPKQFLNIIGNSSLFKQTLARIKTKIPADNVFIVANKKYRSLIHREVVGLKIRKEHILLEPSPKNTAPAIYWAADRIYQENPDAVMIILPSDHYITEIKKFLKLLDEAVLEAQQDYLVTLGIIPTRAETGYGYIKGKKIKAQGKGILKVEKFIEKPDLIKAKQFVENKNYYWNSGMFVFKAKVVLEAFQEYLPQIKDVKKRWNDFPSISIDYGILEKAKNVSVIPAGNIGWSDLGSWEALMDVLPKDKEGNVIQGKNIVIDCQNTFISSDKRMIAAVGLKDIIIVEAGGAFLVCPKNKSQEVKKIISCLSAQKSFQEYA